MAGSKDKASGKQVRPPEPPLSFPLWQNLQTQLHSLVRNQGTSLWKLREQLDRSQPRARVAGALDDTRKSRQHNLRCLLLAQGHVEIRPKESIAVPAAQPQETKFAGTDKLKFLTECGRKWETAGETPPHWQSGRPPLPGGGASEQSESGESLFLRARLSKRQIRQADKLKPDIFGPKVSASPSFGAFWAWKVLIFSKNT